MTEQTAANYPDILGAITRGIRLNMDVVQFALATRPAQVAAGKSFEIILLLQNASDMDVDVVVAPEPPARDLEKKRGRFNVATNRVRVGLRPAEAGFVSIPVSTSPTTTPDAGYEVMVKLDIKRMEKRKPTRVRAAEGGGAVPFNMLPEATQQHLQALNQLVFSSNNGGKRNQIQTVFEVQPPALASLPGEQKAAYVCLWTMRDHADDHAIAQRVWEPAMQVVQQARRDTVFMPLLKATQARFQQCGYALMPPEAIFVTKIMTLVLEMGITEPTEADPHPHWPRWFTSMCRKLHQEPALADRVGALIADLLYQDVAYDAVLHGFTMVQTVTNETFGTAEETAHYADDIADALARQQPLGLARAYLPLILAGIIANTRVTMPREQIRDTVFTLSKAVERRRQEADDSNRFVLEIADKLIERALDTA